MNSPIDRHQLRQRRRAVERILWEIWDPIGLSDSGGPEDEYDSYAGPVFSMLFTQGASADALASHLLQVATEHMGLTDMPSLSRCCFDAAAALITLRQDFEKDDLIQ
jgi:hypothetical protein